MKESETWPNIHLVKNDIERRLGTSVTRFEILHGGFNNRIFRIDSSNDKSYILKWYFKDDRNRLSREFSAFEYLRSQGELRLPIPYFKDNENNYAIYSFEKGKTKSGNELNKRDLDEFLSFTLFLQNLDDNNVRQMFPDTIFATRSAKQFSEVILDKVNKFEDLVKTSDQNSDIARFAKNTDVLRRVDGYIELIKKSYGQMFNEEIDLPSMRLSPVDFGPHNTIFKENGKICFIDFEYFGWDDPSKIVANFITHEGTWGISRDNLNYFIDSYQGNSNLSENIVKRVKMFIPLQSLNWISVLLWSFTPQKLELRKFANPSFDENEYISYLKTRICERLEQLNTFAIS